MSQQASIIALLDTLGIVHDHESSFDSEINLNLLMNMALQCLGGIKLIVSSRRKSLTARKLQIIGQMDDELHQEELSSVACRTTFCSAVRRISSHIASGTDCDDLDPARHLIESFPSIQSIGTSKWMPLHWAVLGDMDHDNDIIQKPPCSFNGSTHNLSLNGNYHNIDPRIQAIQSIAKAYPQSISEFDSEGRSYLHYACRLDSIELVNTAVAISKSPVNLTFVNANGAMPIHNTARFSQSLPLIKYMLQLQPDAINVGNNDGILPLHWAAAKSKNPKIIEELINAYPGGIQIQNHEGYLPLHCSGQNSCLETVMTVLAAYRAGISMSDNEGGYPLHHACCLNSSVSVVKCMYEAYPPAINSPQHSGNLLPIHLATAQNESTEVLKYILSVSPRAAHARDVDGWLPLHCLLSRDKNSMTYKRLESLRILLSANPAGVHFRTISDQTSPVDICMKQHGPLIQRLVCNAHPSGLDPTHRPIYHNLNWQARRIGLEVYRHIVHSSNEDMIVPMDASSSSLRYVLMNLCQKFESHDTITITNGVLRQIILYL